MIRRHPPCPVTRAPKEGEPAGHPASLDSEAREKRAGEYPAPLSPDWGGDSRRSIPPQLRELDDFAVVLTPCLFSKIFETRGALLRTQQDGDGRQADPTATR